jgi:hypothetical protein
MLARCRHRQGLPRTTTSLHRSDSVSFLMFLARGRATLGTPRDDPSRTTSAREPGVTMRRIWSLQPQSK